MLELHQYVSDSGPTATVLSRTIGLFLAVLTLAGFFCLAAGAARASIGTIDRGNERGASARECVKPLGNADLPFPETPVVGFVLAFVGMRLSNSHLYRGRFVWVPIGWIVFVIAGTYTGLWVLPRVCAVM